MISDLLEREFASANARQLKAYFKRLRQQKAASAATQQGSETEIKAGGHKQ